MTTRVTNNHFQQRVIGSYKSYLSERESWGLDHVRKTNPSLPAPVISTLTDEDTTYGPGPYVGSIAAYASPWIDLCSPDPVIASISRQVLNLELAYAGFSGARNIIIPGPRKDGDGSAIVRYARAIQEALQVANRVNIIIHLPMYREPGLEETAETLSSLLQADGEKQEELTDIDIFTTWDSWHTIRSVCEYSPRLFVGWFALAPLQCVAQLD